MIGAAAFRAPSLHRTNDHYSIEFNATPTITELTSRTFFRASVSSDRRYFRREADYEKRPVASGFPIRFQFLPLFFPFFFPPFFSLLGNWIHAWLFTERSFSFEYRREFYIKYSARVLSLCSSLGLQFDREVRSRNRGIRFRFIERDENIHRG